MCFYIKLILNQKISGNENTESALYQMNEFAYSKSKNKSVQNSLRVIYLSKKWPFQKTNVS